MEEYDSCSRSAAAQSVQLERETNHDRRGMVALRQSIVILLTAVLVVITSLTIGLVGIRYSITPEYVHAYATRVDMVNFPVMADGESTVFFKDLHSGFVEAGIRFNEINVKSLMRQFSPNTMFSMTLQAFADWWLEGGESPSLNPALLGIIALSAMDDSLVSVFSVFQDPTQAVGEIFAGVFAHIPLETLCNTLEPTRVLLTQYSVDLLISACLLVAVLLFCACRASLKRFLLPLGIALLITGGVHLALYFLLPVCMQQMVPIYGIYVSVFLKGSLQFSLWAAIVSLVAGVLAVGIWIVCLLCCRCAAKHREQGTCKSTSENGVGEVQAEPENAGEFL